MFIAFPRQKWVREGVKVLRSYVHSLSCCIVREQLTRSTVLTADAHGKTD